MIFLNVFLSNEVNLESEVFSLKNQNKVPLEYWGLFLSVVLVIQEGRGAETACARWLWRINFYSGT
jgi:hypothetical protein